MEKAFCCGKKSSYVRLANILKEEASEIGKIMSVEMGKPIVQSDC